VKASGKATAGFHWGEFTKDKHVSGLPDVQKDFTDFGLLADKKAFKSLNACVVRTPADFDKDLKDFSEGKNELIIIDVVALFDKLPK